MSSDARALVLPFAALDQTQAAIAGGKGAHLAELSKLAGVRVPPGFCVTTHAFDALLASASPIAELIARLAEAPDPGALAGQLRAAIEAAPMPAAVETEILRALAALGEAAPVAVRSSATAEDLPGASFAGQQDTYLNVVGAAEVLRHVRRCWASLFSERAVLYRQRQGFDHRGVKMAVVVQQMVFARVAGVLFTADPLSGNRRVASVEASYGLGEALVSGLVTADVYKVRGDAVVSKTISPKRLAIAASPGGGVRQQPIEPPLQAQPALTDDEAVRLVQLGRRVEAHFGCPQDLEWCLAGDEFQLVQARPITTLFPVPVVTDGENHVWLSVAHQQMMTDAMKPLGLSLFQLFAARAMDSAGGRLFVDVTAQLASPLSRAALLALVGKGDPLFRDALETVLARDFIRTVEARAPAGPPPGARPPPLPNDSSIAAGLMARNQASVDALKLAIAGKTGAELLDFIAADVSELKRLLVEPLSIQAIMAGMEALWWLNEKLEAWLGEKNAADTLTLSVPDNITSQMGLDLLDVADVIRPHPQVVGFLRRAGRDDFLDELPRLPGGSESASAIRGWLEKYGMRCVGEIDVTRPRWAERPTTLLPMLLGNVDSFTAGEAKRRFEHGRQLAARKEEDVLERLRALPDGANKAEQTRHQIERLRTFTGYREYPKYGNINRIFVYKQALMGEADRLVAAGVLSDREDIFFLTFGELQQLVRTRQLDPRLLNERRQTHRVNQALKPPRVLTSEGEGLNGSFRRDDFPPGALVGLAVSAGVVEGRARVLVDPHDSELDPGDILITAYTDPSWTPLFLRIKGLVTEVGGQMTHGAVIAREYGLPAIVNLEKATQLIRDGQRIRLDGTRGYVELLP